MSAKSENLCRSITSRFSGTIYKVTALCFIEAALVTAFAQGQPTSNPFLVRKEMGLVRVESSLRADPPSSSVIGMYAGSSRHRGITHGPTFYTRILLDKANHAYLGYELLLEPQQPGKYLATFGKLGVTPLDLAAGSLPTPAPDSADPQSSIDLAWTMIPLRHFLNRA
jgi:hypothetical protein